jgi:hypothetical protein
LKLEARTREKRNNRIIIRLILENMTNLLFKIQSLVLLGTAGLAASMTTKRKNQSFARSSSVRKGSERRLQDYGKGKGKGKGKEKSAPENTDSYLSEDTDNIFDHDSLVKIDTEDGFLTYCRTQLLSAPVVSDGLISQSDAASFIWDICDIMDDEDLPAFHCPTPEFNNLEPEVQLSFVWYICPHDEQVSLVDCLSSLAVQMTDFGYPVSFTKAIEAQDNVDGFCCSLLPFLKRTNIDAVLGKLIVCCHSQRF